METVGTALGAYAPDFELPGTDGVVHHLARYLEKHSAIVVVFMCNHCPYVKLYLERLKQLQEAVRSQGVTLIGINSNDDQQFPEDSYDKMKTFAAENQINFPYLRDITQDVASAFGAQKTPHVFLLNQQGVLCYKGAIDDNAQNPSAVTHHYLQAAIAAVLKGEMIGQAATEPIGCSVKWRNS